MIRALGFLLGLAAVAAPVAAWLVLTGRVGLPGPTVMSPAAVVAAAPVANTDPAYSPAAPNARSASPQATAMRPETNPLPVAATDPAEAAQLGAQTPEAVAPTGEATGEATEPNLPAAADNAAEDANVSAETPGLIARIEPARDSVEPNASANSAETAHVSAATPKPIAPIELVPEALVEDPAAVPPTGAAAEAVVWKPFRSERAARGFSEHVAQHYGVASEVRRDRPGVYKVVVTAESEQALQQQLDHLRATPGLASLEVQP
jgi:hypothetical protein